MGFLNVLDETDIHAFHKICEKSEYRESMENPKHFEGMGSLNFSGGADISTISGNMGKKNFHNRGKGWESLSILNLWVS